jgi:S1-C subfamily serine protease
MSTSVNPFPPRKRSKRAVFAKKWVGVLFVAASVSSVSGCSSENDRVPIVRLVQVTVSGCTSQEVATGFIARPGVVVTAAHALRDVTVVQVDGKPATVMSVDDRMDAALLRIDDSPQRFVEFADPVASVNVDVLRWQRNRTQRVGATITTVAPIEYSDLRLKTTSLRQGFLLDQESRAGDSGSPVLDDTGRVIGMLFASRSDGQVQGFAVAATELQALLAAPPTVPPWVGVCT